MVKSPCSSAVALHLARLSISVLQHVGPYGQMDTPLRTHKIERPALTCAEDPCRCTVQYGARDRNGNTAAEARP